MAVIWTRNQQYTLKNDASDRVTFRTYHVTDHACAAAAAMASVGVGRALVQLVLPGV